LFCRRAVIDRGNVAHEDKTAPQDAQRCGKPKRRLTLKESGERAIRRDFHNGGSGSLHASRAIEIGNQNIAGFERTSVAKTFRDERNAIRVAIAIEWNC
jgi:hypothetical protein